MDGKTILFVDDDEDILRSLKRQFRKETFSVLTAVGGENALKILSQQKIPIIISDERMPGMNGTQLLHKVKELYPDTIRIILSGYADADSIINLINHGEVYRFVSKPWDKDKLLDIIHQSFTQYEVNQNTRNFIDEIIKENQQLHRELDSRKCSLEITLEVLNKISQPIIAVSKDERIGNLNNKARKLYKDEIEPGKSLEEQFSENIREKILEGLSLPGGKKSFNVEIEGRCIKLYTRALRPQDPYKGLVIFEF